MGGGQQCIDLLPNYYDVLNVNVHGGIHEVPEAFYRRINDPSTANVDSYRLVYDAYDCLSNTIDRASYNAFYFHTPCWYSKPLWIAYRNERRRLEEKQLRRDREAREKEKASVRFVEETLPASPPAIFYEIDDTVETDHHSVDAVGAVDTIDITGTIGTIETHGTASVTDAAALDAFGALGALDAAGKAFVDFEDIEAAATTKHQLAATPKPALADAAPVKTKMKKKKKRARRGGKKKRNGSEKKKEIAPEEAAVVTKSDKEEEKGEQEEPVHKKAAQNDLGNGRSIATTTVVVGTTQRPAKTLAHSRWADPHRCSDGLAGHPYEKWQVKPGFDKCMGCSVWHYGSVFRCGKCSTVFCKSCYAKTTTLRLHSVDATA
ncbi:hypothetical protein SCUCBS95973_007179 [Sporothrix curviconia]|uniref:J domain-containing protein n=1 Tax=Sporothrix curviconia TaxID=1260050 RepID=A0ABP0CBA2_9PEZI